MRSRFHRAAAPVLAGEREQREKFDVALDAREDDRPHRLDTAAVSGDARQHPLLRPAPVAVHDDRHVPGTSDVAGMSRVELGNMGLREPVAMCGVVGGCAAAARQIAIRSVSLAASTLSISAMAVGELLDIGLRVPLVVLCHRVVLQQFLQVVVRVAADVTHGDAASSASWRTTLISSLRRSSVSAGIGTRMISPDVAGLRPRSESRIAFSITAIIFFSTAAP
jgi:hypothetical protein